MNKSNQHSQIFSQRLKNIRQEMGLSQKQLGILAGIDEFVASTRINRYEKGVHQPNVEIVQHIASVLGVPLAYFYTEDDLLAELLRVWPRLEPKTQREILLLVSSSSL